MRGPKELLIASKAFASETRWLSWWHLLFSLGLFFATSSIAYSDLPLSIRIPTSLLSGLLIVRLFIIYHDFNHGAILKNSMVARGIMHLYGCFVLSPPSVWNHSHDHHHKHNSRHFGANVGSFPLMSISDFQNAGFWERKGYAFARHPLTIVCGYLTVFFYGMSLRAFLMNPVRHADAGFAVFMHLGLGIALGMAGWDKLLLCLIVPLVLSCGLGAYLFYAQHNFPACYLGRAKHWSHVNAALKSSSFIRMSWLMNWFTGNVGFHHIHHLNAKIPFYRLPEAMSAIDELQHPGMTSLSPKDVFACLRLKLWDEKLERLVSFREASGSIGKL